MRCLFVVCCACVAGVVRADTDFDRMERLAEAQYGIAAKKTIQDWREMIADSRKVSDRVKLERANAFVNGHVLYADDIVLWHQTDYWATPLETFGKQAGDCEDYAIAKYITLRLMDIPVQKLRLFYVRARLSGADGNRTQAHMVLSYFKSPTADPLVLDILRHEILPASRRPDLFPIFSFNHEGLWMEGEKTSSSNPRTRLSRWRDVLQRMRREGWDPSLSMLSYRSLLSWETAEVRPALRLVDRSRSSKSKLVKAKRPQKKIAKAKFRSSVKKIAKARPTHKAHKKVAKSPPLLRKVARI